MSNTSALTDNKHLAFFEMLFDNIIKVKQEKSQSTKNDIDSPTK